MIRGLGWLKIVGGVFVVVLFFFGTLFALDLFSPGAAPERAPALTQMRPLPAATRNSVMIAPAAIAMTAIRTALDNAAPRDFSGKPDNPLGQLLSKAEIGWQVSRTPIGVAGRSDGLAITTGLNGSLRVTGQLGTQVGSLGGAITGLVNEGLGRNVGDLAGKVLDQRADIRGNVTVTSRPAITPEWRIEPHLTAQVNVAEAILSIAGARLTVSKEVRPLLDKAVAEQMGQLQARLRSDPILETTARREWAKMCRSIALPGGAGLPNLWLEMRPTRAFAAQPRIDPNAVTLTMGVQAETRIVANETKPSCPFPARLEIVPQMDQGSVSIGVPIDVPFTEVNRLLDAQLKDKTFPEDGSGPVGVTVLSSKLVPSGERLLISLRVKARERKSWFGFGTEANVHIWGKPVLDQAQQILRMEELSLAVESEAAFGLLGAAARTAMPYLEAALAKNAVVDLKPFATSARKSIEGAIADFKKVEEGVRVEAAITELRLAGIEYDSKTLRVIAEAEGNVRVGVTKLPGM